MKKIFEINYYFIIYLKYFLRIKINLIRIVKLGFDLS